MHEKFLLAALEQAQLGQGLCAPNPSVGAVAVKNDHIIARAWHRGAGTPHAEKLIIDQLPVKEQGITLYVTLEPCNHYGRTPPCVDAIVDYGFEKVVYAFTDPNPIVAANDSPKKLAAQGIKVERYAMPEIDDFYKDYRFWMRTGYPWVTAKIAQTFDGKIAGVGGKRVQLSNADCEQFTHQNRLKHDIILTSAQTVNRDNPQLNVRLTGFECSKPIAILDRQLSLNFASTVLQTASHCHIFYDKRHPKPLQTENHTYHPVTAEGAGLSLLEVNKQLGLLGYYRVWLEAGGSLFTAMHQANLVNCSYVYLVPSVLGDGAIDAYHQQGLFDSAARISWIPMGNNMISKLEWERLCSQA
jgi:diaminohydroxyphosphoribosylaminopyrimidine deaminase/5-amino-6-(5-phosphoribosylamino)uracil reductase